MNIFNSTENIIYNEETTLESRLNRLENYIQVHGMEN